MIHTSVRRAELHWTPTGQVVALVGSGDSRKTTILDAIALLFTPRVSVGFSDADFFMGDPSAGLRIEGTISELPRSLLSDDRLGLELRGVDDLGVLHDEPGDFEPAVTVRLEVSESLEPTWSVVTDRNPEGRILPARDRALLGVARIGTSGDRQFSFARGTALSRMATSTDQLNEALARAYRLAREVVAGADFADLDGAIDMAERAASELGAGPVAEDLEIRLEASSNGAGGLGLHSSGIPLSAAGLGTRRLLALSLELLGIGDGAVLCIDEIEAGLEPHRLRHLLRVLRRKVETERSGRGQIIFTTHSPVALEELRVDELAVVRTTDGQTEIRPVPDELTPVVRTVPEAFLARRVLVCEGKSEIGIVRAHDSVWASRHESRSLGHVGVVPALGGGTSTGERARAFAQLGYPTAALADSDASFEPGHGELEAIGVMVVRWQGNCCIEERAFEDLHWESVLQLFAILVEEGYLPGQLVDVMATTEAGSAALECLGVDRGALGSSLEEMLTAGLSESEIRRSFGQAAKGRKAAWFKRIDTGERLGQVIAADLAAGAADLGRKLHQIENWCYAE